MNGISHKQARRYILADQDGLLSDAQRLDLQAHLAGCEACRAESESLSTLTLRLQSEFHERWDAQDGPSKNVMTNVHSQSRRIFMSNRVNFGLRAFGGIAALLVLGFGLIAMISQMRNTSVAANKTATPDNFMPASSPGQEGRLLAFTKEEGGNYDVYTIHADGSNLTNLTNDPARDTNPAWSPDGKHIAFESDRNGFTQIYLMNANGSDIIQLTNDKADHALGAKVGEFVQPWSPDGSKLIFSQWSRGEDHFILYTMNTSGKDRKALTDEQGIYLKPIWSSDGKYIAFVSFDEQVGIDRLYIADADGSDNNEITEVLPSDERLYTFNYYWSPNEPFIVFITSNERSGQWAVYEASPDGKALTRKAESAEPIEQWLNGTSLILKGNNSYTWLRSDDAMTSLAPLNKCAPDDKSSFSSTRSSSGNLFINVNCSNGDFWFYLANSNGTETRQVLDSPMHAKDGSPFIAWSPDDKFIAVNLASPDKTVIHILNIEETFKDPSAQPVQIPVGDSALYYIPSWQPVKVEDAVQEKPIQTSSYDGLLAFTSATENGNLDIYTMHPDGSNLTNLTNDSAHDSNPIWSPNGKRIIFESDRAGFTQIFLMDPDGSNIVQLTNDEADHYLPLNIDGHTSPWSPDGSKLLYLQRTPSEEEWTLYTMDLNGKNKTLLTTGRILLSGISWSPDGKHIGYVQNDTPDKTPLSYPFNIYIVDADGSNQREMKKLIPQNEYFDTGFQWSADGVSIIFTAYESYPYIETVYELNLETNSIIEKATFTSRVLDWQDDVSLIMPSETSDTIFTWQLRNGTSNTLDWGAECWEINFRRSHSGEFAIGAYCPDHKSGFYWANADGSMAKKLLLPPTDDMISGLGEIAWSADDRYIAFVIPSSKITYMYILNVEEFLKDPSAEPVQVVIGGGDLYFGPSWQPEP